MTTRCCLNCAVCVALDSFNRSGNSLGTVPNLPIPSPPLLPTRLTMLPTCKVNSQTLKRPQRPHPHNFLWLTSGDLVQGLQCAAEDADAVGQQQWPEQNSISLLWRRQGRGRRAAGVARLKSTGQQSTRTRPRSPTRPLLSRKTNN